MKNASIATAAYVPLNLRISANVKSAIKDYAATRGRSVSEIVENMLAGLTGVKKMPDADIEIPPFVKNFHAGIGKINIPADLDYKKMVAEMADKKYA